MRPRHPPPATAQGHWRPTRTQEKLRTWILACTRHLAYPAIIDNSNSTLISLRCPRQNHDLKQNTKSQGSQNSTQDTKSERRSHRIPNLKNQEFKNGQLGPILVVLTNWCTYYGPRP